MDLKEKALYLLSSAHSRIADLDGTVDSKRLSEISGEWGKGQKRFGLSVYTGKDEYHAHEEIGTFFCDDSKGLLFFWGRDDTSWYLMGVLEDGDNAVILKYGSEEGMELFGIFGNLDFEVGIKLQCFKHYKS